MEEVKVRSVSCEQAVTSCRRSTRGNEITLTLAGRAVMSIACEECNVPYQFAIDRNVIEYEFSVFGLNDKGAKARAEKRARARLQRILDRDIDPVPCPKCGHYAMTMVARLRTKYHGWLSWLGRWILGLSLIPIGVAVALGVMNIFEAVPPNVFAPQGPLGPDTLSAFGTVFAVWNVLGLGLIGMQWALRGFHDPNAGDREQRKQLGKARCSNVVPQNG